MTAQMPPKDWVTQQAIRHHRLRAPHLVPWDVVKQLQPDWLGRLVHTTRSEAKALGLTVYTSTLLSELDKLFCSTWGVPVTIRYTDDDTTEGLRRLKAALLEPVQAAQNRASIAASLEGVSA